LPSQRCHPSDATPATKLVALLFCLDERDALPDKLIMRTLLLEGGRAFSACSEIFPEGQIGLCCQVVRKAQWRVKKAGECGWEKEMRRDPSEVA